MRWRTQQCAVRRQRRPSADQEIALADLDNASAKARDVLDANCRPDQTLTPTGRLVAVEDRLNATHQAIDTVQPRLAKFFDSLRDEQKARFDRLGVKPV